ncbi:MAG TPA: SPOR domain-containing protein [Bacteriovoracaceae bacterium]|nr:SPOR domain-containing protein [Bacteriovoracaceae bacterium]
MEENNKVIIFEKKEIIIVLIFVVVLIITSFTLGIRLGKKLSMVEKGLTAEDVKSVELKSAAEEDAEATATEDAKLTDDEKLKKLMDESKLRLSDELEKVSSEEKPAGTVPSSPDAPAPSSMAGKFTIQLGSYDTMEEAKQFAEGFTVRGYNPIINEVKIEGKGDWYRVSLGLFDSVDAAKEYVKTEQSLFSGQDHIITEIK